MTADYTYEDILKAYAAIGVKRGSTVMLRTDLRWLGRYAGATPTAVLAAHADALAELIDLSQGTLVFPTASASLCNTSIPFDSATTPSEMGVLTEYLRRLPQAARSFHPFVSYGAVGRLATEICGRTSRHSYGPETPEARLVDLDALDVSVGLHPRFTTSLVHHIEQVMGVPYRYTKEFEHPVVRENGVVTEPFYMLVRYLECELVRNKNVKLFEKFHAGGGEVLQCALGRGHVHAMRMRKFYDIGVKSLAESIYIWLDAPPANRPYRR